MSQGAMEQSKGSRGLCQACHDRRARFRFRGEVRADRDHTLCFQCFRAQRDSARATTLAEPRPAAALPAAVPPRSLTAAELEHRRRMLSHLQQVSCGVGA